MKCEMAYVSGGKWKTREKKKLGYKFETTTFKWIRKDVNLKTKDQSSRRHTEGRRGFFMVRRISGVREGERSTGPVVRSIPLFSVYLPIWLFFGQMSKENSFYLAGSTDSSFSFCPPESRRLPFSTLQVPRRSNWRLQGKPSSATHDRTLKGE